MSTIELPDGVEIPQTTPRVERQRLVAKGKFLAEHCLSDGHTDCVLGFVEHCLGKSPPQLDVVVDLWSDLRQDYEQLLGATAVEAEQRAVLLQELLQDVTSRLKDAVRRMTETG
jgi:hypothetical protein